MRSHVAAAAKSLQSCPTLCDPIDGSPWGSPIPGGAPPLPHHVRCCQIFLHFALKRGNSFRWQSVGSRQDIANVLTNLFFLSRIALWLSLYCQECFPLNLPFYIRKPLVSGDPTVVLHSQDSSLQLQPLLRQNQYRGEEKPLRATTIINTALSSPACVPSSNLLWLLKDFPFSSSLFYVS